MADYWFNFHCQQGRVTSYNTIIRVNRQNSA